MSETDNKQAPAPGSAGKGEPGNAKNPIGAIIALALIGGLIALLFAYPILLVPLFAIVLLTGIQGALGEKLGAPKAAALMIALVAIAGVVTVRLKAQIEVCFVVGCCASSVFLFSRAAFAPDSFAASLVRGLGRFALVMTAITGLLFGLSSYLTAFPPQNILNWGERLESLTGFVEKAEKMSVALLVVMIAVYFLLFEWKRKDGWFRISWSWTKRLKGLVEQASLLLACLSAFTFVAGGTTNGPVQTLTEERADALSKYKQVEWEINIAFQSRVAFEVAQNIYNASPPAVKQALAVENQLLSRATPAAYSKPGFTGMTADDFLSTPDPRRQRRRSLLLSATLAAGKESAARATAFPKTPVTLKQLDAIAAETDQINQSQRKRVPEWLTGLGPDVVAEIVELVVSADRIAALRNFGDQAPLERKLVDTVFDTVDESTTERIRTLADQTVIDRLTGKIGSLAEGLAQASAAILSRLSVRIPSPADWEGPERRVYENKPVADSAQERFQQDLKTALDSEQSAAAKELEQYRQLAGTGLESKSVQGEVSIENLRATREARNLMEAKLADFVYRNPGNDRLKSILGADLGRFRALGQDRETARVQQQQQVDAEKARIDREAHPVERE